MSSAAVKVSSRLFFRSSIFRAGPPIVAPLNGVNFVIIVIIKYLNPCTNLCTSSFHPAASLLRHILLVELTPGPIPFQVVIL